MNKQKLRSEIDEKDKWDLKTIYKSEEEFSTDLEDIKKEVKKLETFKGKLTKSAKNLYNFLSFSDELELKIYKLFVYAKLDYDSDTTNTKAKDRMGKIEELLTIYSVSNSYVLPELLSVKYTVIKGFIKEEKALEKYKYNLEKIYRFEKHKLNEDEEKILSEFSNVLSASEKIYSSLTDSDLTFGTIKDKEEYELTSSNYSKFIESKNRRVRKEAFSKMLNAYGNFRNTICDIYNTYVEYSIRSAKLHKFNSSLEASLFNDNVDVKVYNNVIDVVHKNLNVLYKYYATKKDCLKLDELHIYDIYVDLVKNCSRQYSFEEAKDIVLNSLSILGDDYINNLNKAFDERWIDIYNNKGKISGAYSSGTYGTNPFVLLNFEGEFLDVTTLAHELGHSMHTYYSCKYNTYNNSSYEIFVAEVASTVNELLVYYYLLENSKTKKEKLSILNRLMNLYKSTIFRQTMFAEFEKNIHKKKEEGVILTPEFIENEYYNLNKIYYGENVVVDEEIKYEWSYVPHFYNDFYVYMYAIGLSCACHIVKNIKENKENAKENYLKFLKTGGSMDPIDELKIAGVDVEDPKIYESAISMFNDVIDEFNKLNK